MASSLSSLSPSCAWIVMSIVVFVGPITAVVYRCDCSDDFISITILMVAIVIAILVVLLIARPRTLWSHFVITPSCTRIVLTVPIRSYRVVSNFIKTLHILSYHLLCWYVFILSSPIWCNPILSLPVLSHPALYPVITYAILSYALVFYAILSYSIHPR